MTLSFNETQIATPPPHCCTNDNPPMDFLNRFFVTGDAGGEPVVERAELEEDEHEFADYEDSFGLNACVVA